VALLIKMLCCECFSNPNIPKELQQAKDLSTKVAE
jgi:hypothetical protein